MSIIIANTEPARMILPLKMKRKRFLHLKDSLLHVRRQQPRCSYGVIVSTVSVIRIPSLPMLKANVTMINATHVLSMIYSDINTLEELKK